MNVPQEVLLVAASLFTKTDFSSWSKAAQPLSAYSMVLDSYGILQYTAQCARSIDDIMEVLFLYKCSPFALNVYAPCSVLSPL